ncbi:hypothetical protein FGIG_00672 [Fasciola gigantica]|uniref:Uncharacterized protein n=1 Tax=Fasciola gigantica TaxID=46835 RepID=A0A504Y348_FASGI|nr:hypothetical protein FGIG_00672 [Fasciola gigantica]
MSASMDDTSPMTPFSQRYIVRLRIPVPLSSNDSAVEIPLSQSVRRESPMQSPDSPGDIMALGHSSPSPPIMTYQWRSTEDATLSNVSYISITATKLATTPLSPQQMPAYAKKWQVNFLILSYYDYQTTLNVCCQIKMAFTATWP